MMHPNPPSPEVNLKQRAEIITKAGGSQMFRCLRTGRLRPRRIEQVPRV